MDTIGLIGVGLLGSAIAARLTAAGYGVLGYDLLPERRLGAGSAQEVAGKCRTIMLCLPTSDVVAEVLGSDQADGGDHDHRLHHRRTGGDGGDGREAGEVHRSTIWMLRCSAPAAWSAAAPRW